MKKQFKFISLILLGVIFLGSCVPSIGTAWYPRKVSDDKPKIFITSLSVMGNPVQNTEDDGTPDAFGNSNGYSVELESGIYTISADNITVTAFDDSVRTKQLIVGVDVVGREIVFKPGESIIIVVKINDSEYKYAELEKIIKISVDKLDKEEEPEDYITDSEGNKIPNPVSPNGEKKITVGIMTTMETKPVSEYYHENFDFPASKFDDWVLNMPSMSGVIASYKFRDGIWTGTPEFCDNIPGLIGSGLKSIDQIKIYRYKTRRDRWDGTYSPTHDSMDDRFYFYRFTARASAGIYPDNSMFCVDRYSKFLFWYSEPNSISGLGVPSGWTDYAAPDSGIHHQSSQAFYKTDPVGYVKKDGSVVIYDWVKTKINASNYAAPLNSSYASVAEKNAGKPGHSPYRNANITYEKKDITTTQNPKYTAEKPIILKQPQSISAKVGSNVSFTVEVTVPPQAMYGAQAEELSYQWYKNTSASNTGGELIYGAVNASYTPDSNTEKIAYFYCIVANKNKDNNKTETTISDVAKLIITSGTLITDAALPNILKQPVGKTIKLGENTPVRLKLQASTPDGGILSYQWYEKNPRAINGFSMISGAVSPVYEFVPNPTAGDLIEGLQYYCVVKNTNNAVNGNKTAIKKTEIVTINIEKAHRVNFSVAGGGGGTLTALYQGKVIKNNAYVKHGGKVQFIASPQRFHKVKTWSGVAPLSSPSDKTLAEMTVTDEVNVAVSFEEKMRLTITPKIYNENLRSWCTADSCHFSHGYIEGVHLAYACSMKWSKKGSSSRSKNWKHFWPLYNKSGYWIMVENNDFIDTAGYKYGNSNELVVDIDSVGDMKITLSNYLLKANRHDYWYAEWTTWGGGQVYPLQAIDNNSTFPLIFKETDGVWRVDRTNVNIKKSSYISLPSKYTGTKPVPNRRISYKNVTIRYDENFTLPEGEEKDFVITYIIDNHDETRSKGTVKVVYTMKWE